MNKGEAPLISIITLNYNQVDITCAFLESTRDLLYPNYEILVCDMASDTDPTSRIDELNFPNTRVLRSKKNLGFAGGNNWGMRQAKGDYFFIVNNDTEVTPDLLDKLIKPFYEDDEIGEDGEEKKVKENGIELDVKLPNKLVNADKDARQLDFELITK